MAKKKKGWQYARIFDPATGRYKTVRRTKEIEKQIQARQKELQAERKRQTKRNIKQAAEKKLEQLQKLNPGMYTGYYVAPSGKITNKKSSYEREKERLKKAIKKAHAEGKKYENLHRKYALNEIRHSKKGRAMQALKDINDLRKGLNTIIRTLPEELRAAVIGAIGGELNEDSELEDYYLEKYEEEMLPSMLKEVKTIEDQIKIALNVLEDYKKKSTLNLNTQLGNINNEIEAIGAEINRLKNEQYRQNPESEERDNIGAEIQGNLNTIKQKEKQMNDLIEKQNETNEIIDIALNALRAQLEIVHASKTAQQYRANVAPGESEPKYKNDLAESGL